MIISIYEVYATTNNLLKKSMCPMQSLISEPRVALIKRLGNVFQLKSSFLNLTTTDFSVESGCYFSSP